MMKSYLLKCLLGLAMILPGWNGNLASGQETSTQEKEVGFTSLFDGKTLKGWEGNREIFRVQQGAIIAGSLQSPVKHNEFLCSEKKYGDFELRLEAKLTGAGRNAGIQFRSQRIENHFEVSGYQCDMGVMNNKNIWGWLYDESRRRTFLVQAADVLGTKFNNDDWNDITIRCSGKQIQIWVNGVMTVKYREQQENIPRLGVIGLQIHGGPPSQAAYRNIRIKKL